MSTRASLTMTPIDVLKFQNDLIKTGQSLPLGRAKIIAIGPNDKCPPLDTWDPFMKKYGRMIDLRKRPMPLRQYPAAGNPSMILVPAFLRSERGLVELPDLPDPTWRPADFSPEEITGRKEIDPATGKTIYVPVPRAAEKDTPRMLAQSLRDRADSQMADTNYLVFSPVLSISFQPEQNGQMLGTFWAVNCSYNPADRTHPSLLIDEHTGETHFFGGLYDIVRAAGEN